MRVFLIAMAVMAAVAAYTPATAAVETCAAAPTALRALAAKAEPDVARKAERNISLGVALCNARNPAEASRKFKLAAKELGTNLETALTPAAQSASAE